MAIDYMRQKQHFDVTNFRDRNRITIVGCGAIGSFVGMSLAKMGFIHFKLWDMDKVEPHNLPNQFFTERDVRSLKSQALFDIMCEFNKLVESEVNFKYCGEAPESQIVISCADSMKVRKELFEACKKDKTVQLFIDTRMAGLQGQVYTVEMDKKDMIENYEKTLFSDKEAVQDRCTAQSLLFTVLGIASLVCNQIAKACREEELPNYMVLDYSVPQLM